MTAKNLTVTVISFVVICVGVVLLFQRSQESAVGVGHPTRLTPNDKNLANVFRPLDGEWHGHFYIYEDPHEPRQGEPKPEIDADFDPVGSGFRLVETVEVSQTYMSSNPYLQRVVIRDRYKDENGNERVVESSGVNKVENGKMWCIVHKPNETVVLEGEHADSSTIIWSRNLEDPRRMEWFKETVTSDIYTIVGYGYYDGDDLKLPPRVWFRGSYQKVNAD